MEEGDVGSLENLFEKFDMFGNINFLVLYFILGLYFEEDKKVLESIFLIVFSVGLKR